MRWNRGAAGRRKPGRLAWPPGQAGWTSFLRLFFDDLAAFLRGGVGENACPLHGTVLGLFQLLLSLGGIAGERHREQAVLG